MNFPNEISILNIVVNTSFCRRIPLFLPVPCKFRLETLTTAIDLRPLSLSHGFFQAFTSISQQIDARKTVTTAFDYIFFGGNWCNKFLKFPSEYAIIGISIFTECGYTSCIPAQGKCAMTPRHTQPLSVFAGTEQEACATLAKSSLCVLFLRRDFFGGCVRGEILIFQFARTVII